MDERWLASFAHLDASTHPSGSYE